jgi:predicted phage terminase large subunit-like protein
MELTAAQIKAAYKTDLSLFIARTFSIVSPSVEYIPNWHIDLIAEYLTACQRGEIKRLIINIPPRMLKSISVSIAFPAWLLGHNPSDQIMVASYSQALSSKHHMDCRLVMQSEWYRGLFPDTVLADDMNTQKKFVTSKRGHRIASSVGGTITGEGANFLIVDDPLSAQEGQSETFRNRCNDWFDQTYVTRLNDKKTGCIIIIMQRLHQNDLVGYLLDKGGWEHLCLPVQFSKASTYTKGSIVKNVEIDDYLHPARIGQNEIAKIKAEMGSYAYAGQMLQSPNPLGGGEFLSAWLNYYETISIKTLNIYILVDPANSKRKKSDYTALWVIGVGGDKNIYIIDIVRTKIHLKEREDMLFEMHMKYKPKEVLYQQYGMEGDIQHYRTAMEDRNYRFHITPVTNPLNKQDRIRRLVPIFYENRIWFPRRMYKSDWENKPIDIVDVFIHQEYLTFPVGLHDDMLDSLCMICDTTLQYPGVNTVDYYALYK